MTTPWLSVDVVEEISSEASSGSRFVNPSKIEGEKRFRFFGQGITGFSGWTTDKKLLRWELKPTELPSNLAPDKSGRVGVKRFIASVVYDYEAEEFKIIEITQRRLMEQLFKYIKDEDYGDPTLYDVKINKTGQGIDTDYSLIASPPRVPAKEVLAAYKDVYCNLRALFDSDDPWAAPQA
jgi:hypothetical protein